MGPLCANCCPSTSITGTDPKVNSGFLLKNSSTEILSSSNFNFPTVRAKRIGSARALSGKYVNFKAQVWVAIFRETVLFGRVFCQVSCFCFVFAFACSVNKVLSRTFQIVNTSNLNKCYVFMFS
mmetsp:Transcript_11883/g.25525  ORF Transcript_11883/g.25525 Transcript_11883/m.25525 type:complete len:124 (-) Transcript_11883:87-458(-)